MEKKYQSFFSLHVFIGELTDVLKNLFVFIRIYRQYLGPYRRLIIRYMIRKLIDRKERSAMFEHSSRKVNSSGNRVKIVAFGSYHSGKTSFIKCIDPSPLTTEAKNYDGTTTVALDLAIKEYKGYKIYVYGTPGQDRFEVAREVVSFGLHAGIVIVDSTRGMTDFEKRIVSELRQNNIPYIILANKQDLPGASIDRVKRDAGGARNVLPISARTGQGVDVVLDAIVDMARGMIA